MKEKRNVRSDAASQSGDKIKVVLAVLTQCGLILSLFVVAVFAV